ncbi:MAG TPA: AbrB/MazE/SpoVT family DNA-binding domain-containing protein [Limnochordia bacterium]|nr:AbrB/MazE/SpoVT family DNA-binding domain-containing protein [Limnochordia bacterium]
MPRFRARVEGIHLHLPAEVLARCGFEAGDRLSFVVQGGCVLVRKALGAAAGRSAGECGARDCARAHRAAKRQAI